jgi:hypothetical protein
MAGYTKEFLVDAYLSRYAILGVEKLPAMRNMAEQHYDNVGKDQFRVSASLDADAIKKFKLESGRKS